MKVILRQDHETLGKMGSLLEVKDGYARNYLLPRGLVYPATVKFERQLEEERRLRQKREVHKQRSAQELAELISRASVVLTRKSGEDGRLFGSVTSHEISEALLAQGIELDRRKIVLDEPIKLLGNYQVRVHLYETINATLTVSVLKEDE